MTMSYIPAALVALLGPAMAIDMGDENCPCTGDISLIPDGQQNKEIGYGSDCREWDVQMGYCLEQEQGNGYKDGFDWCAQEWCYVDRDNCGNVFLDDGEEVDPLIQQSVIYPSVELYFSYNTCGNRDTFSGSNIVWVWDFGECQNRTANDYFMLVDGSASVLGEWEEVKKAMIVMMEEGMNVGVDTPDGDRVAMVEFAGKRPFGVSDTVTVFDFDDDRSAAIDATNAMDNLEGQTWTLAGLQRVVEEWKVIPDINTLDRHKLLVLITDGRPKPRTTASDAEGDTSEPGCIDPMLDDSLPQCENNDPTYKDGECRYLQCKDVDVSNTDCCPGDQNPCTADERDALLQELRDFDILIVVIAVGANSGIKSEPYDCVPENCVPGGRDECKCEYDLYYFDCLLKPDYDQSADAVPHRVTTISDFSSFFEYQDPSATEQGGTDGALCIDPRLLLPPAPPTSACTEIPEPKDVVIVLDSSKSMYTQRQRTGTARQNWISVMTDLQGVICLFNSLADPDIHRCAFSTRDNVGLVRFSTQVITEYDFNTPSSQWWTNIIFTTVVDGATESAMNRKQLGFMTDTVAGLWEAYDQMEKMDEDTIVLQDGEERTKRREIVLITDGRPHCKRDRVTFCRPCAPEFRDETLLREQRANAQLKMIWRGDRNTHDGTITVDKDQLRQDEWFGCLDIDFDDDADFVVIEEFSDDLFRDTLMGDTVCVQQQS